MFSFASAVMYWNDIMSHKARTLMSKLRRQSRVRPYRERAEITPLLANSNSGHKANDYKTNGKSTVIELDERSDNRLYPLLEENEGKFRKISNKHSVKISIFQPVICFL